MVSPSGPRARCTGRKPTCNFRAWMTTSIQWAVTSDDVDFRCRNPEESSTRCEVPCAIHSADVKNKNASRGLRKFRPVCSDRSRAELYRPRLADDLREGLKNGEVETASLGPEVLGGTQRYRCRDRTDVRSTLARLTPGGPTA